MSSRYGLTEGASDRKWEVHDARFDIAKEPNEQFRFGYVIEVDPYDPTSTPVKHTALGRTKHEAANVAISRWGHAVAYSGDDERFDYLYKFVSKGKYDPANRAAAMQLLDDGILYAAKFNDDGTGEWLPLIAGDGPLVPANGFASQGDVAIFSRGAADLIGATAMDRPEDVEISPTTGKVYMACTNNTRRTEEEIDAANPRAENAHGHIIEIAEDRGDHASLTFTWEMFILAGDAADGADYAGFSAEEVSAFSVPDNLLFDKSGNLWVATDGQPSARDAADGVFAVPTEGSSRGLARQLLSGPTGAEIASFMFNPDDTALFVSVQHPGEGDGSTLASPTSTWPNGDSPPRPSVIVVTKKDGGVIGT
jgi:secreted PhoX family phosphatase